MAADIAARLQLNPDDTAQLLFLVEHHLLMSHLAQRRDHPTTRASSTDFAKRVETLANLKTLYLLTFADMAGSGPQNLEQLARHAARRTLHADPRRVRARGLCRGRLRAAGAARETARAAAAADVDATSVQHFLADMPDRYFLGTAEDSIAHSHAAGRPHGRCPVPHRGQALRGTRLQRVHGPPRATAPGLFSMLTASSWRTA